MEETIIKDGFVFARLFDFSIIIKIIKEDIIPICDEKMCVEFENFISILEDKNTIMNVQNIFNLYYVCIIYSSQKPEHMIKFRFRNSDEIERFSILYTYNDLETDSLVLWTKFNMQFMKNKTYCRLCDADKETTTLITFDTTTKEKTVKKQKEIECSHCFFSSVIE